MGRVAAVVVTYNRKDLLKECLEALINNTDKNCDVLVIDNASDDGTKAHIKKLVDNKKVFYFNTGKNIGGAGGFNYGMKKAYELGYDFIWLMDDDCIVQESSLSELLKAHKRLNGDYGFLSSKVLWKDGSLCQMNKQKKTLSKWLKDFDTNYQTIALGSFVSFFIKSATVKKYGLPIKEFFIWTDDWEYARRISRNEKCYFISSSVVTHKSRENIGASIATADDRLDRFKYLYRNDCVLYRREGIKGWFLLRMRLLLHKFRILKSNKKDKKERLAIMRNAIKDGKKFRPVVEMARKKDQKIKVVEFFGEQLNYGGQEAFIKNVYENIDKENFEFTFITPFECQNIQLKKMIEENGDHLIVDNQCFESKLRKKYIVRTAKKYLSNTYDVVHIHSGSVYTLLNVAKIAKKRGLRKIIVHSHATGLRSFKYRIIKFISDLNLEKYADKFFACSDDAARFKFPKAVIREKRYQIVKNGINVSDYKFNNDIRMRKRRELGIGKNEILIGHIGRYSPEKNHKLIIDVFDKMHGENKKNRLLLVGDGPLKNEILESVRLRGLDKAVIALEKRDDINQLLMTLDVFVFPSIFEGLGLALVEAQASGVPSLCSDSVPDEIIIKDNCHSVAGFDIDKWAKRTKMCVSEKRIINNRDIIAAGFDIIDSCRQLEEEYNV